MGRHRPALPHRHSLIPQAELLLRTGNRDQAAAILAEALHTADQLGAQPLADTVTALARRGRLTLPDRRAHNPTTVALNISARKPEQPAPSALGLTDRELAVLRLLAEGKTNSEIGAALFISRKTASVHVTNILRKLDVTSRVQAATAAERAGLLAPR